MERFVHKSGTSYVILGSDRSSVGDAEGGGNGFKVALKFFKDKSQFQRELIARTGFEASTHQLIIPILASYDGDTNASLLTALSGIEELSEYRYLHVFPLMERSLFDMLSHDNLCGNYDRVQVIIRQIAACLQLTHEHGKIHGDIKPLNIMMNQSGEMMLIDLDASAEMETVCGAKYSSAYLPPEMMAMVTGMTGGDQGASVRILDPSSANPLLATASYDMWALGILTYYLCTGQTLWQASVEDNLVSDCDMRDLLNWSNTMKDSKLSNISNPMARNLVHQLLSKDPQYRPSAADVLSHPFITGHTPNCRLPGQPCTYKIFISYRVAADKTTANNLYNLLHGQGITTFLDSVCLPPKLGKNWETEFVMGLGGSDVFVPVISREAINSPIKFWQDITKLREDSECDNVLLEYRMAIELHARGLILKIAPLFVGDQVGSTATEVTKYSFRDDPATGLSACHPNISASPAASVVVASVEQKVRDHLDAMGLGSPYKASMTVSEILDTICKFQGIFLEGQVQDSLKHASTQLIEHIRAGTASSIGGSDGAQSNEISEDPAVIIRQISDERDAAVAEKDAAVAEKDLLSQKISALEAELARTSASY